MKTIAQIMWTCPQCSEHNSDEQDDEYGPFSSVVCTDCGKAYSMDSVPGLEIVPN